MKRIILTSLSIIVILYGLFWAYIKLSTQVDNRVIRFGVDFQSGSFAGSSQTDVLFGFGKSTDKEPVSEFLGTKKRDLTVTLKDRKTFERVVACIPSYNLIGAKQVKFNKNKQEYIETIVKLKNAALATLQFEALKTTPSFYNSVPKGRLERKDETLNLTNICAVHINVTKGKSRGKTLDVTHAFGVSGSAFALTQGESWALLLENYEIDGVVLKLIGLTSDSGDGVYAQTEFQIDRSDY